MRSIFLLLFGFLISCSWQSSGEDGDLVRGLSLLQEQDRTVSLAIQGTIKDDSGQPVANAVIQTNANSFSTALSLQRNSTSAIRCVDYALARQKIQCLKIIKPSLFSKQASNGC